VGTRLASPRITTPRAAGDPGLFGPASEAWRLDREAMLLLGAGPRALLLQIAHPSVAAGVEEHSDFRADPWRRLDGTLRSYLAVTYGSTARARGEIRRLNALHRGINGPGYSARDPQLALWVHATLIDSSLTVADAWLEPLARDRRARFYEETRPVGRAFGIPDSLLPADLDAFEAYMAAMLAPDGPIRVSTTARGLAETILHPPLGPLIPALRRVPPQLYSWALWPAVGLLPERIRDEFGLRWGPAERAASAWLVAGWRAWRPLIPTGWRWMPQAIAADRRVAATDGQ
jgi:uncharacterized protein (DUF2236 family)